METALQKCFNKNTELEGKSNDNSLILTESNAQSSKRMLNNGLNYS